MHRALPAVDNEKVIPLNVSMTSRRLFFGVTAVERGGGRSGGRRKVGRGEKVGGNGEKPA